MVRPSGWDILGLDGDPTPGVVESVQALAREFGDFAHDVEAAYRSLNSFGSDTAAMKWIGQTADSFKKQYGPLPGRLQKLYTSYSEASDALSAYAPLLQAAQTKADMALRQAQDAHADLQRATTSANNAAADLKTAQNNQATNPNQQAVTDAQTAHDTAQTNLNNAKARMAALTKQADDAYNDRITAAKACASALGKAQGDGIHNKSWWDHVAEDLSEWGGEIAKVAGELAPILMVVALATSWIPGVDVVTAALAEADNLVALAGTAMATIGDAMQGHWGDALLGVGMLGLAAIGAGGEGEALEGEAGALEGEAAGAENAIGDEARTAEGDGPAITEDDPVDVVSGWMLTDATDLDLPGTLPLVLRRAYASGYTTGHLFGPGWSSTLDQRISINATGIHFAGDDAQRLDYPMPVQGEQVLPTRGARWPLTWDREADEIRVTDPWTGHTRHFGVVHFSNEIGQIRDLTAITDRNGNRISILRDEQGTPTGVEHPGYRVAVDTVATSFGPRISGLRVLDATGADSGAVAKKFGYDDRGRLIGVFNSSGLPFSYEWDKHNRIIAWRDRAGYRFGYHYDHLGRVVRGEGSFLAGTFDYRPADRTTVYTNSLGHTTTFVYDQHGHVTSEIDPLGNTTLTTTDPYGRVLSRTDALGATTTYERDDAGDVRRVVTAVGATTELAYNDFHQVVRVTSPDGTAWHRDYDDRGNLLRVIDPMQAVTELEYTSSGAPLSVTDALGARTRYTVDPAGLTLSITDPLGATNTVVRDPAGRIVEYLDALGAATRYEWSADGLPVSRTEPDGATLRRRYDDDGRLLEIMDPIGAVTVYEPGPLGTLAARTGPDGVRYAFTYDSELNMLSVTNPEGASWGYTYDPAGRLVAESDFIGRELRYAWDAAGRLASHTNGVGQVTTLTRDAGGRVVTRATPEGEYAYVYDEAGRLTGATGPGSALSYQRNARDQVVSETVDGRTTRFSYDAVGRRIGRTTASGAESTWTYDPGGRPIGMDAGSTRIGFAFDAAGREIERSLGGGAWLQREYDSAGRRVTEQLTAGVADGVPGRESSPASMARPVLSRSWAWRADGLPEVVQDSLRGTRRIVLDAAGRVTAVSARDWSENFAYDTFGNLAADGGGDKDVGSIGFGEPAVAAAGTLVRQIGRTHHDYDTAGRLIRKVRRTLDGRRKTWTYTWDSEDRLVEAVTPDHGSWRYSYDPIGRRTMKARVTEEGLRDQVFFTWDGPRLVEQQATVDGTVDAVTWDYDPGSFRPAAQRRRSWAQGADQSAIDEVFHAIITDLVGTPTELVTPNGHIAWHITSSVWGRDIAVGADDGLDCPLRFPGQYHDDETGLHYNLHRYYSPETAAYLTPDPLGLNPSPNDHAYVRNPIAYSDPLGLYETMDFAHGTTAEHADDIAENGLNGDAARAAAHGGTGDKPGSLFTYQVDGGGDPNFSRAAQWGVTRNGGVKDGAAVLVFRMSKENYTRLLGEGHITTQVTDQTTGVVEHIFGPGAMPFLAKIADIRL